MLYNLLLEVAKTYSFLWQPEDNLDDPSSPNPITSSQEPITYTLTVWDSKGCVSKDTLILSVLTSIDDFTIELFNVYPNPTEGILNIKLNIEDFKGDLHLSLINQEGKIIHKKSIHSAGIFNETIKLNLLTKGLYMVRVEHSGKVLIRKIIVQ